jgi:very-short-patch-repair endonuclease
VVELDRSQHAVQVDVDRARTALPTQHGYRVLRFWNSEVLEDMEAVLQQIAAAMEGPHWVEGKNEARTEKRSPG